MKTLRCYRGSETTYFYCTHYQATEVRAGSQVAEREGNKVGWQFELRGVTSTMREVETPTGLAVQSDTLQTSTVFVHVPTDYELAEEVVPKGNGPEWRLLKTYQVVPVETEDRESEVA